MHDLLGDWTGILLLNVSEWKPHRKQPNNVQTNWLNFYCTKGETSARRFKDCGLRVQLLSDVRRAGS